MRTTIDLEDDLLREAKMEAIRKGLTLKELIGAALHEYLRPASKTSETAHRVTGGFFTSGAPGTLVITKEMIDQAEFEDDLKRSGLLGYDDPS